MTEYGVIKNKKDGRTKSVWIDGTTVSYIFTQYCGSKQTWDKKEWDVIYRGTQNECKVSVDDRSAERTFSRY